MHQSLKAERDAECARLTQTIAELEAEVKRLRTVVATAAESLPGGQARMLLYYENVKHAKKKSSAGSASPAAVEPAGMPHDDSARRMTTKTAARNHANSATATQSSATTRIPQHRKAPERKGMVRPEPSISWRGHQEEPSSRDLGFVHAAYRQTGGLADQND